MVLLSLTRVKQMAAAAVDVKSNAQSKKIAIQGPRGSGVTTWKNLLGDDYIEVGREMIPGDPFAVNASAALGMCGSIHIMDSGMYGRIMEYDGDLNYFDDCISAWRSLGPLLFVWVLNPEYKMNEDKYLEEFKRVMANLSIPGIIVTRGQSDACDIIKQRMNHLTSTSDEKRSVGG